jgi:DUF1365 family protein
MHSALYRGSVRHRRFAPVAHEFRYRLFLLYLDLAELDEVFAGRWLWSSSRPAWARFDRRDHLGDPAEPLDVSVRNLVERETGTRPAGPIRLLTHLRYFGYCFNPVSFYYCFDAAGTRVDTIVAEVNNTPWGEQHCYVMKADAVRAGHARFIFDKAFHVSPFMPMNLGYDWRFSEPGYALYIHMILNGEHKVFDATLQLEQLPLTGANLARMLIQFPFMTVKVVAAIHWQALKLWLKRVPVHTHPDKTSAQST